MIASIQITNTEILALIAVLVFMLLCFKLLFANKKIQKELLKSSLLFKIIENFTGKYCKIIVASSFKNAEIFAFVFFLVFKLLSCKIVFINRKDSRNYYKSLLLFIKIANLTRKSLQNNKKVGIRNFQDTFETCNRSFISAFSICMFVPLR